MSTSMTASRISIRINGRETGRMDRVVFNVSERFGPPEARGAVGYVNYQGRVAVVRKDEDGKLFIVGNAAHLETHGKAMVRAIKL